MLLRPRPEIRYAVVGLGHIAQTAVLPAFKKARANSRLVALVSGDREKLKQTGEEYQIDKLYLYSEFEQCLRNNEVDAVYIATPNFNHRNIMETAAQYGVHVLCEKPMAVTKEDCLSMINEAEKNNIHLMIAYRLHFELANLEVIKLAHTKRIGDLKLFNSAFSIVVEDKNSVRLLEDEKGGGPLYDIGIYCINAARHIFKSEPVEVFAMTVSGKDSKFRKTEESISAILKFPDDKLATFSVSFSAGHSADYELLGTRGKIRLERAYRHDKSMHLKIYEGNKIITKKYSRRDHFAPGIIYFSDCIQKKKRPVPSGEEGLIDVKIIEALLLSIDLGTPIRIEEINKRPSLLRPKLFNTFNSSGTKHQ